MARQSDKLKQGEGEFKAVYKVVDQRSEGRCEFYEPGPLGRCPRPARDHHHLYKPRRIAHHPGLIVHLCRAHHDRCEWPYKRGRLVISLYGGRFVFAIRFFANKFAARDEPRPSTG